MTEAQDWVLGSMALDPGCIPLVCETLKPQMFTGRNQEIFTALVNIHEQERPVDPVELKKEGLTAEEILQITDSVPHTKNVEYYAGNVFEEFRKAEVERLGHEILSIAKTENTSLDMLSKLNKAVESHTIHSEPEKLVKVSDIAKAISWTQGGSERILTGLRGIDDVIIGIGRGDYVIIAGRPGMGKSSLLADIACNISWGEGIPTSFYSLEMEPEQLVRRIASARCEVPLYAVEKGFATDLQIELLKEACSQMEDCPIYLKKEVLSPSILKRKILEDQRKYDIKAVFVDYLQLMRPDGNSRSQYEDLTGISRGVMSASKTTGIPIIMASQLRRTEGAKRPTMTDFRGTGAIEEDADVIIGLHRPGYYDREIPPEDTEALILKGRHFGTGVADLHFNGSLTHFIDKEI